MSDTKELKLEELDTYFLMGIKDGEHVTAQSPNITGQDLSGMVARVKFALDVQTAELGCAAHFEKVRRAKSPLIAPSS